MKLYLQIRFDENLCAYLVEKMLNILKKNKKKCYLIFIGLVLPAYFLSIIFSEGFSHPDEHYQILEFAKYKLGEVKASELPWEFPNKMRPAVQPWIAYGAIKLTRFFLFSDKTAILLLRLLSGILGLLTYLFLLNQSFPKIKQRQLAYVSILFCLTIWFLPYCHVRFASENWGGIFFWLGCYLLIKKETSFINLLFSGALLGLSFQFRYQMGFCIIGLFLWLLVIREKFKITKSILVPFVCMWIVIVAVTYFIDAWLYEEHVIPAYNYFYQNIILNKSAGFTQSNLGAIYYIVRSAEAFILPFGLFFIFLILYFFYLKPKHIFTWILAPYLLVHFVLSNQQLRFMLPLVYICPIIIVSTVSMLSDQYQRKFLKIWNQKWFKISLGIYFVINSIILFERATYPAYSKMSSINFINHDIKQNFGNKRAHILSISTNPFYAIRSLSLSLPLSFYRPKSLTEFAIPRGQIAFYTREKIQEFIAQKIESFYLTVKHTRFYQGDPPFHGELKFLEKKCDYLFNMLDKPRIKYNIYRMIRQGGSLHSTYLCKI